MGIHEVGQVVHELQSRIASLSIGIDGARVLAWIGILLIALVVLYYIVIGVTKAVKAFLNMRVKYLGLLLLTLGVACLGLAMVLP